MLAVTRASLARLRVPAYFLRSLRVHSEANVRQRIVSERIAKKGCRQGGRSRRSITQTGS
jgi:hypothetical protein